MRHSSHGGLRRVMRRRFGIACVYIATLWWPTQSFATACEAPDFVHQEIEHDRSQAGFPVSIGATVQATVPAGFDRMALSSFAVVLGYPGAKSAVVGLETVESIASVTADTTPAAFYESVFSGANKSGCDVLVGLGLDEMEYRVLLTAESIRIFAYGKGDMHQFYAIRSDKPDAVVGGRFRGIDRAEFNVILSSIVPL